jgi:uncharacterized membrane protein
MIEKIAIWFLIFMVYSFGGWLIEVIVSLIDRKKFVNRGFLIGPICPIYGTGAVILSLMLNRTENIIAIFCVSLVGGAVLEYCASFVMEKLFRVRWWDYAEKSVNINGRICMSSVLSFGLAGIFIVEFITPFLYSLFSNTYTPLMLTGAAILSAWMFCDVLLSLWLILGVRVTVGTVQRDATDEISTRVQEILMNKGKLNRRLVKAFPNQSPSKKTPRKTRKK